MDSANNYHRWILDLFRPYLGPRVAEVGAGIGSFSRIILEATHVQQLTALEPAANLFPILNQRLQADPRAQALPELSARLDTRTSPRFHRRSERDGAHPGRPAVPARREPHPLTGGDDFTVCAGLAAVVRQARCPIRPFPALLEVPTTHSTLCIRRFPCRSRLHYARPHRHRVSWYITGKILRRTTIPASNVQFYDRVVIPVIRRLESVVIPPVGQNLVAVGRKL